MYLHWSSANLQPKQYELMCTWRRLEHFEVDIQLAPSYQIEQVDIPQLTIESPMNKHKDSVYISMLKKRGAYISHHLCKMQATALKVLRQRPSANPIREIKSLFGVYEVLLLQVVNDLKFTELEQFAVAIQQLFKQVLESSLYFVKGLLLTFQKNFLPSKKEQPQPDEKQSLNQLAIEKRMYEFREKFYYDFQKDIKMEVEQQTVNDEEFNRLLSEVQTQKENIMGQASEASASICLREAMQYLSKSAIGSNLVMLNAQTDIRNSDDQLKQTENVNTLLDKVVSEKQKKLKLFRDTLMGQLIYKRPTQNGSTQTTIPMLIPNIFNEAPLVNFKRESNRVKEYTKPTEYEEEELASRLVEQHQTNKQMRQATVKIQALSENVLELRELVADKNQQIGKLRTLLNPPKPLEEIRNTEQLPETKDPIAAAPITSFPGLKEKKQVFFRTKSKKASGGNDQHMTQEDLDIQDLIEIEAQTGGPTQQELSARTKDEIQNMSFMWGIIYDAVSEKPVTKSQFVIIVKEQMNKNGAAIVKKSLLPKSKSTRLARKTPTRPSSKKQHGSKTPASTQLEHNENATRPTQTLKNPKPNNTNNMLFKLVAKPILKVKIQNNIQVSVKDCNTNVTTRLRSNLVPGDQTQTFVCLLPYRDQSIQVPKIKKPTSLKYQPRGLQAKVQQEKYAIGLYHHCSRLKMTNPPIFTRLMGEINLGQMVNRNCLKLEQFCLAVSKCVDKHRPCIPQPGSVFCQHLWNFLSYK